MIAEDQILSIYVNPPAVQTSEVQQQKQQKIFQETAVETGSLVDLNNNGEHHENNFTNNNLNLQFNLLSNNNNNSNNICLSNKVDLFTALSFPKQEEIELDQNFQCQNNDVMLEDLFKQQSFHNHSNFPAFNPIDTLQLSQQNTLFPRLSEKQLTQKQCSIKSIIKQEPYPQQQQLFLTNKKQSSRRQSFLLDTQTQQQQQQDQPMFEFPDFDLEQNDDDHETESLQKDTPEINSSLDNSHTTEELQNPIFNNKNEDKKIWKVTQNIKKKKKQQRDYDKNICRYLARCIVRCFVDKTYMVEVSEFCNEVLSSASPALNANTTKTARLYQSSTSFLLSKIEFITGHRAFRDLLCYEDDDPKKIEKQVFRKFTHWFLRERAFRYIITGAMTDKQSYLKFKNQIMLLYVNKPEKWNSNTNAKKTQKSKNSKKL